MSDKPQVTVALALGSNMGDRAASLRAAIEAMKPYIQIQATSPVYETAAAYVTDQPAFLNAAIIGTTALEPLPLLWMVKDIESEVGRMPTFRYGPRVIDIDIIFYGDTVMRTPELSLPHLRVAEREFVLRPLNHIAPNMQHPETGYSIATMLAQLPETGMTIQDIDL